MNKVNIYKAGSNALGGDFSEVYTNDLFTTLVDTRKLACLYVKNDSYKVKTLLSIEIESPDIFEIGIRRDSSDIIIKNQIEPVLENGLPLVIFQGSPLINLNYTLAPNDFVCIWVYLTLSIASQINYKRTVNINVRSY